MYILEMLSKIRAVTGVGAVGRFVHTEPFHVQGHPMDLFLKISVLLANFC